jgi:hypothetical protein
MATNPPEVRTIKHRRELPFVEIEKVSETRGDHALMLVLMVSTTIVAGATSIPAAFGFVTAFIGGHAFCNWVSYPQRYGRAD